MDSLEEIDEIVKSTFGNKDQLKEDEFIDIVENKKSDIYLQLLCFFYQKKPFNEQNINMLKVYRRKQTNEGDIQVGSSPEQKRIRSPNRKSYLSPADSVLKLNLCGDDESNSKNNTDMLKKKSSFMNVDLTPESSGMKGVVRMANQKVAALKGEDINQTMKNSKNIFNSPSIFLKKREKGANINFGEFSLESNLIKMDSLNLDDDSELDADKVENAEMDGLSLDRLDLDCSHYQPAPELLNAASNEAPVTETLYSNLLKSNCLVTGQPDWGSVSISYSGAQIEQAGLLQYIVSFRNHNEFHEHCVERIFMDIWARCKPTKLTVYARYTRRGGVDINPWRSSHAQGLPAQVRTARQ